MLHPSLRRLQLEWILLPAFLVADEQNSQDTETQRQETVTALHRHTHSGTLTTKWTHATVPLVKIAEVARAAIVQYYHRPH